MIIAGENRPPASVFDGVFYFGAIGGHDDLVGDTKGDYLLPYADDQGSPAEETKRLAREARGAESGGYYC
jgi:hypothetical protein